MACHTRSTSLPTRCHPFVLKAEEELNKLRASVTSHSISYEIMVDAIRAVGRVYESINDLLSISSIRNDLPHSKQRKLVDQELEESIKLIDICSTSKDNLDSIRGQIQDLESALRRGGSEVSRTAVNKYIILVKKANKDVKKLSAAGKIESAVANFSDVPSLLLEIREFTSCPLQSIFSFLPKQIVRQKTSKWPALKSLLQKNRVAFQKSVDNVLDISSFVTKVGTLENELEILFRHLIKFRVSLLNISCI